jgi:prophage lambdaSa04, DNA polymerase
VARMLADGAPSEAVQRMLEIRQELGKTSNKKYAAMDAGAGEGGRVRGLLQFYGANRTGRWAGRLVQVQNLPRTHLPGIELARERVKAEDVDTLRMLYGSVPDTLSQLIRTALVPAPGHRFVDADFSAIEARVIAWLSGEEWVLDVFRTHGKIYEATASQMFGVPLERIKKGNPEYDLRQKGKVATLALGYQGGVGALINMGALSMGIPEDELPGIVQRWRQANRRIVAFWYAVEAAATDVVRTGRPQAVGRLLFALQGDADTGQWFLTVTLPSGRVLFYAKPFLAQNAKGFEQLHYYGMNQTSKKWGVQETYGGKLAENITQAVARDCLAENIERLEAAGYPVVFHVHDEVVIETETEHADLSAVCDIMARPILWAPDLPLKAEGWTGGFYTKD